ncbi:ThiF family protein [Sphingobacterium alimentarium]|uniref:ThiF family protein n=1 Tax=Sphingobacterium alimentarium TaxID=797292 RepID=A0A4R3VZX9_9SPHI|nr:ThiF family adenylyltransferase [Sphingobacterium alimentarium]TCV18759.1 ThiF family protein [Sphingobacterium alimentarium]
MENSFKAEILQIGQPEDQRKIDVLLNDKSIQKFDTIYTQLEELIKIKFPAVNFSIAEMNEAIRTHLQGRNMEEYGLWVYYPWSKRLVHTLYEEEFVSVRTNRNQLKITKEEQDILRTKTVGIIGLSVGQSIALTMAMERICGTIKLADFDTAELSNLNRIRTGIHNLNINKTVIAAREIAEIDPFIDVKIYQEGLTDQNMEDFMLGTSKLDVLVEVCDGLDIKINSRIAAKKFRIPVIMETNDKCMLDVERYDINENYPILHGLIYEAEVHSLDNLSGEDRMNLVKQIVNVENLSARMLDSFGAMGKSIRSWPQLASSVTMGGAVTTDVTRKILLGEDVVSGRCYFDIDEVLRNNSMYNN